MAADESAAKKRKLARRADERMHEGVVQTSPQSTTESERSESDEEQRKAAVKRLLEPFAREQLVEMLANAAMQYEALYAEVKAVAGADVAHRKVFVRGLAWETKTEHLKEAFAAFGDVQEGTVVYDKTTGKSKGYGFVTFVEMEAAQKAVEQETVVIDGRKTSCNLAAVRHDDHQHQPQHSHSTQTSPSPRGQPQQPVRSMAGPRPSPVTAYPAPPSSGMYPMMQVPQGVPPPPSLQQQQPPQQSQPPPQQQGSRHNDDAADRKLFVRGLAWETTDDTLRREFQTFGDLEEATIARDKATNKSKGFGFVTYKHKSGADRALQSPKKLIDGRATMCNLACQGHNKPHTEKRSSGPPLQTPMPPSYAMPMAPATMYTTMTTMPYPGVVTMQQMPQQPMAFGQYPGMPFVQQPQVYAAPPAYYQGRPQPQPHLQQPPKMQPPPPRRFKQEPTH